MNRTLYSLFLFFFMAAGLSAQCPITAGTLYGSATAPTTSNTLVSISNGSFGNCNWLVERDEILSVVSGQTYVLSIDTGNNNSYTTVYNAAGALLVHGLLTSAGTPLSFTANDSGTYTVVVSLSASDCTTPEQVCRIVSVECTSCPAPCVLNSTCDTATGETFCNCTDCETLCTNAAATFLDYNPIAAATSPVVYCESAISTTPNPIPAAIYIPIAPTGTGLECVTWDISTTHGTLYNSAPTIAPTTSIENGFIFFLRMTDADLAAADTTTTITFTAAGTANPCTFTFDVDWTGTILQDDGTAWAGSAAAQCGCISPMATVDFDCASRSLVVSVTDPGTPGFEITVPGTGLPAQTIGATVPMDYSFSPLTSDSTYSVIISDGNAACNLFASGIYPDCLVLGPDCNDLIVDGGLDSIPTQNWVEYTDTNTVVITEAIINAWNTRLLGTGSAWLGGWGDSTRTSTTYISQDVTLPTGTAMLYFWGNLTMCDSPDDIATVLVDDIPTTWMINGGDAQCGTATWIEYSVDLSAYADGGLHTIKIQMTEAGTNGGNTNFFIDEITLESCATGCPDTLYVPGPILSGIYEAAIKVRSDGTVDAAANVTFRADNCIDLEPLFCVPSGTEFCARIAPCGTAARSAFDKKIDFSNFKSLNNNIFDIKSLKGIKRQALNQKMLYSKTVSKKEILLQQKAGKSTFSKVNR